jgi:hypothetical protein
MTAPAPEYDLSAFMRRLALAVVRQGVKDFRETRDPDIWIDAKRFLFPENAIDEEFLRWTVEVSAIDSYRLGDYLVRAREETPPPSGVRTCKHHGPLPAQQWIKGTCRKCWNARRRRRIGALERAPGIKKATEFLEAYLTPNGQTSKDVRAAAKQNSIPSWALYRARRALRVEISRTLPPKGRIWRLGDCETEKKPPAKELPYPARCDSSPRIA